MIPNNNFYGKKHGKSIRDFTSNLDYSLETVDARVSHIKDKLEINENDEVQFAHDYFVDLFEQTFDTLLDKDGVYWVEEEQRHMNSNEFVNWANRNDINISEYLEIQTAFDTIEYDGDINRGDWDYSNINTSSVKLVLNSHDAQYSEGNIAKELTRLADFILAKDKREDRTKVKVYSEQEFKKRLIEEKKKMGTLGQVNDEEFAVLKRVKNYRLAPKLEVDKTDYTLSSIYAGTYEDYLDHWRSHQFKNILTDKGYKRVYIEDLNNVTTSVCMTEEQWNKGKLNMIEKSMLLEDANKNKLYLQDKIYRTKQGVSLKGVKLMHITNNLKNVNEYMGMVKKSYSNFVCIKPMKCSVNSNILDVVDYNNEDHILALIKMQVIDEDLNNDMSILSYDIKNAIKKSFEVGDIDEKDIEIIQLWKHGKTKEEIADIFDMSRMAIYKRLKKITVAIRKALRSRKK